MSPKEISLLLHAALRPGHTQDCDVTSSLRSVVLCWMLLFSHLLQKQTDMGSDPGSVIYHPRDLNTFCRVSDFLLVKFLTLRIALSFGDSIYTVSGTHSACGGYILAT